MSHWSDSWYTHIGIKEIEYEEEEVAKEKQEKPAYDEEEYKEVARRAVAKETERQQQYQDTLLSWDSTYDRHCAFCTVTGDHPIEHSWFYSSSREIDGLNRTRVYQKVVNLEDEQYLEYYKVKVEQVNKVEINLSYGVKTREYGRVFFDKEIRYVLPGEVTVPTLKKVQAKGYCKVGNKRVYGKYKRLPRKRIYLDKHGPSILKSLSCIGILCQHLSRRVKYLNSWYGRWEVGGRSCVSVLYEEYRHYNYDYITWLANTTDQPIESEIDRRERLQEKYEYDLRWLYFERDI